MRNPHGEFVWYELMTTDTDAAKSFYGELLGWSFSSFPQDEMPYELASADGPPVAGLMTLAPEMLEHGATPLWAGYIGVDDVDVSAAAITQAGGQILMEPWTIPGAGRMAFLTDPQGVKLYIMRGEADEPSESFTGESPRNGHCGWNELVTTDLPDAKRFYGDVFEWIRHDSIDMGPAGVYELFRLGKEVAHMCGGMMQKSDDAPDPLWNFYFRVAGISAAQRYVEAKGGVIVNGPMEVPGGDHVLNAIDPQGAAFSLIGSK